jgi:hypothetical protein
VPQHGAELTEYEKSFGVRGHMCAKSRRHSTPTRRARRGGATHQRAACVFAGAVDVRWWRHAASSIRMNGYCAHMRHSS